MRTHSESRGKWYTVPGFPETWLGMQLAYDLAQSRALERKIKVKRIAAA